MTPERSLSAIFTIAAPVFAIIAAGVIAGRVGVLSGDDARALNLFVFKIAMPAALFGLTASAPPITGADAVYVSAYAAAAMAGMAIGYALARLAWRLPPPEAGAHALASVFGNAVFLGLPIALSVPGWAQSFVLLMLVEGIVVISVGAALMTPRSDGFTLASFLKPVRNPLVAAMSAGLAVSVVAHGLNVSAPEPVTRFFDLLGRAAGPTALFSLGLFLATNPPAAIRPIAGKVFSIIIINMAVLPILTLTFLAALGITDPTRLGPAALFTLVPVAVGAFVMASGAGRYQTETAAAVAVSTLLSVISVSGVLAAFA